MILNTTEMPKAQSQVRHYFTLHCIQVETLTNQMFINEYTRQRYGSFTIHDHQSGPETQPGLQ